MSLTLDRYVSLRRVSSVTPSLDGTWLAVAISRLDPDGAKYVSDLWRVPLDQNPPTQLTWGRSNDRAPCFRADGSLGFLSNRVPREGKPEEGDEERSQVWILPAQGGEPIPLTDEPLGVSAFRFAKDTLIVQASVLPNVPHEEQRKTYLERKKGPSALHYTQSPIRFWDHWLPQEVSHLIAYTAEGKERRDLTPFLTRSFADDWFSWEVSSDGAGVACTPFRYTEDRLSVSDLVWIDTKTGARQDLREGKGNETFGDVLISPDQKMIAFARMETSKEALGPTKVILFDRETQSSRELSLSLDLAPHLLSFSNDGGSLLCAASYYGDSPIFQISLASGEVTRLTKEGCFEGAKFTSKGEIVGVGHTVFHPPEPFVCKAEAGASPRLLGPFSGFTAEEGLALVKLDELVVAAPDGGHVRGFVVSPKEAGKKPTLLWIHGGPIGAFHNGWHWRWNPLLLAAQGYTVALPNPRGSLGYGQDFIEGIWKNQWGGACYRDLMAFTEALEKHPACDEDRIGAMGGSFGGYMVNWIAGQSKRFRCLVSHAGLFHFEAFYGTTDGATWWAQEFGLTPYENVEVFERYSPHRFISQWKTPTLVIHGEKDYRVPVSEALMLFEALQHYKVPSELLIFPDENHWILKPRNIKAWYETISTFLKKYLSA